MYIYMYHIYMHEYISQYICIYIVYIYSIYINTYVYKPCLTGGYCTCFQGQRGKTMSRCGRASMPQRFLPPACCTPSSRSTSRRTSLKGARCSPTMGTPFGQRPKSTFTVSCYCLSFIYHAILYVCMNSYIYHCICINVYQKIYMMYILV
jgi:hypothetical protein